MRAFFLIRGFLNRNSSFYWNRLTSKECKDFDLIFLGIFLIAYAVFSIFVVYWSVLSVGANRRWVFKKLGDKLIYNFI
jgi:hypothetical protein